MAQITQYPSYSPKRGDRVFVDDLSLTPVGGASATIVGPSGISPGAWLVQVDGRPGTWAVTTRKLTLLNRPADEVPPRPEVPSFMRSDAVMVWWAGKRPSHSLSFTEGDLRAFARMYTQAADRRHFDDTYK